MSNFQKKIETLITDEIKSLTDDNVKDRMANLVYCLLYSLEVAISISPILQDDKIALIEESFNKMVKNIKNNDELERLDKILITKEGE